MALLDTTPPLAPRVPKLREGDWSREQVKEFKQLAVKLARKQLKPLSLEPATFKLYNAEVCRLACKLAQAAGRPKASSLTTQSVNEFVIRALNVVEGAGTRELDK
jgi:hypothetical protein